MADGFSQEFLSTSALAKALHLPVKNMFGMLAEHGWIARRNEKWVLTAKGEYEGGQYRNSDKYGQYIVWPKNVFQHHVLQGASKHLHLNATDIGEEWGIPGRLINKMLAELGWIKSTVKGWELTSQGKKQQGLQLENDDSGALYCVWPATIREQGALSRLASQLLVQADDDLFNNTRSIDGHDCASIEHKRLCDWLYLVGIQYAYQRELGESDYHADFYLPQHRLYIEFWGPSKANDIVQRMAKMRWFDENDRHVIELSGDQLDDLDHTLSKLLLENGVKVY